MEYEVRTQKELDQAVAKAGPSDLIVVQGTGWFSLSETPAATVEARGSSSPTVVARGSSSPRVVAWGSSSPTVEARGSSSPTVVARGSSSPTVVAWGSSSPTVEAWESSSPTVVAWGSSSPRVVARGSSSPRVVAWGSSSPTGSVGRFAVVVARVAESATFDLPGAIVLEEPDLSTAEAWCDYHGVEVKRGIATLYKAVDDDYSISRAREKGITYAPGTKPEAPDWDEGRAECGGGLHFSPTPLAGLEFNSEATKYVACGVRLGEIVTHPDDVYPNKVKAPRVVRACIEVDEDGKPVDVVAEVVAS